jgi:serine/threonine-protein kinase
MGERDREGSPLPRAGDVIAGKYEIEESLGAGAMGVVFAARHTLLGHRVAIKLVAVPSWRRERARARFAREARAVATLESEHIVRLLDFGVLEDGTPYLVMQHLVGRDLASEVAVRGGRIPIVEVADYGIQVCAGLAEAHARGIVHRDIKPRNLFVTRGTGGQAFLKILDFGISKLLEDSDDNDPALTDSACLLGSPAYMSPEQVRQSSDVDHRTDIWALGVVLYELCAGARPFQGNGVSALLAAIAADAPRPVREVNADVPADLEAAIGRCLQRAPTVRYASAAALAKALEPFASERGRLLATKLDLDARTHPAHAARAAPAASVPEPGPTPAGGTEPADGKTAVTIVENTAALPGATSHGRLRRARRPAAALVALCGGAALVAGALRVSDDYRTAPRSVQAIQESSPAEAREPASASTVAAVTAPTSSVDSTPPSLTSPAAASVTDLAALRTGARAAPPVAAGVPPVTGPARAKRLPTAGTVANGSTAPAGTGAAPAVPAPSALASERPGNPLNAHY